MEWVAVSRLGLLAWQDEEDKRGNALKEHRFFLIEHLKLAYAIHMGFLAVSVAPLQQLFQLAARPSTEVAEAVRMAALELRFNEMAFLESIFLELVAAMHAVCPGQTCRPALEPLADMVSLAAATHRQPSLALQTCNVPATGSNPAAACMSGVSTQPRHPVGNPTLHHATTFAPCLQGVGAGPALLCPNEASLGGHPGGSVQAINLKRAQLQEAELPVTSNVLQYWAPDPLRVLHVLPMLEFCKPSAHGRSGVRLSRVVRAWG